MLGALGLLAIVLSVIGLYGVVAYTVAQRTHEIGVRMALGAQKADVEWMVLARGLRLAGIGVAAGLVLSAAGTRFLRASAWRGSVRPGGIRGRGAGVDGDRDARELCAGAASRPVDPAVSLRYE